MGWQRTANPGSGHHYHLVSQVLLIHISASIESFTWIGVQFSLELATDNVADYSDISSSQLAQQ